MYYRFTEAYYKTGLVCDFCYEVCTFLPKRLIGNSRIFGLKLF